MKRISLGFLTLLSLSNLVHAASGNDILGRWLTPEGKAHIEIYPCMDTRYCGRIAWLKEPHYPADDDQGMAGEIKIDRENPDPKLRGRHTLGLEILWDFRVAGHRAWEDGKIYDPENGKTYRCLMTLTDGDTLHVRGYIGFSFIGRTSTWTRIPLGNQP